MRPPADAIAAARARTGWARLTLDTRGRRVRQPGGVSVDLSSIGKGIAVDEVAAHLCRLGVTSYLVEIGVSCAATVPSRTAHRGGSPLSAHGLAGREIGSRGSDRRAPRSVGRDIGRLPALL